jgi:hypothetical protein
VGCTPEARALDALRIRPAADSLWTVSGSAAVVRMQT